MSTTKTLPPKKKGRRNERKAERPLQPEALPAQPPELSATGKRVKLIVAAICLATGLAAYGPTLLKLVDVWNKEPDYSHGFLVVPLAIAFLWIRRSKFPGLAASSPILAIGLLAVSLGLRYAGAKYFFTFMDGWSIVPWAASVAAVIGGRPLLVWCLPSIGFLIFMVPLPFRIEGELSAPLQRIATKLSTTGLQLLGQSAFNEGNKIWLEGEPVPLEVAQACSGLRLFVSVLALTYAYMAIINRPWWEKLLLGLASIPIAIVSNSARIVATGLLYRLTKSEWLRQMAHDSAGWAMIVFAAVLFWIFLAYLRLVIREEESADIGAIVRQAKI